MATIVGKTTWTNGFTVSWQSILRSLLGNAHYTVMDYRTFNQLGITLSSIGFGTWPIGGNSYGPVSDKESRKTLEFAFEHGINVFDSANIYGDGHSETILGEVFECRRERVFLTTKAGYTDYLRRKQDFSDHHLRQSVEASLRRFRSDYVDFFFLHSPPSRIVASERTSDIMSALRAEGKIKYRGVSVRTSFDGLIALKNGNYDVLQVAVNLADVRAIQNGLLDLAEQRGTLLFIKAPLAYGFLTGKYGKDSDFGIDDHRRRLPLTERIRAIECAQRVAFLTGHGTPAQVAIQFCLSLSPVTIPIPGMKTIRQVTENIGLFQGPRLTNQELERIRRSVA